MPEVLRAVTGNANLSSDFFMIPLTAVLETLIRLAASASPISRNIFQTFQGRIDSFTPTSGFRVTKMLQNQDRSYNNGQVMGAC